MKKLSHKNDKNFPFASENQNLDIFHSIIESGLEQKIDHIKKKVIIEILIDIEEYLHISIFKSHLLG